MHLQLLPMEEGDVTYLYQIMGESAKNDLMAILYPTGYTKEDNDFIVQKNLREWRAHPDTIKFMKVIDTDLPDDHRYAKVVGAAKWHVYPRDRTDEEMEAAEAESKKDEGHPPNANTAFMKEFFGHLGKLCKENVGNKANVFLSLLATHPDYYRRGIGSMHMKWGVDTADKLGIISYVEASPMGRPLYERYGYDWVADVPYDPRAWGLDHDLPHACLLRPARVANGHSS